MLLTTARICLILNYPLPSVEMSQRIEVLVHGQVTIIFVLSVGLSVCLFVCLFVQFFSAVFDPISIKLGHMLYASV